MSDETGRRRDDQAVRRFVERFTPMLAEAGLPRMAARIFAPLDFDRRDPAGRDLAPQARDRRDPGATGPRAAGHATTAAPAEVGTERLGGPPLALPGTQWAVRLRKQGENAQPPGLPGSGAALV
jgi:hypothetical protein